jgi:small subunit ribosomal protein S21e
MTRPKLQLAWNRKKSWTLIGKSYIVATFCSQHIFFATTFTEINLSYKAMQNEAGENVDLYVPRKCSWTNRLVAAKDHASVQINVANVDPVTGVSTGDYTPYCLTGYIRFKSESDMALTALVEQNDAKLMNPTEE